MLELGTMTASVSKQQQQQQQHLHQQPNDAAAIYAPTVVQPNGKGQPNSTLRRSRSLTAAMTQASGDVSDSPKRPSKTENTKSSGNPLPCEHDDTGMGEEEEEAEAEAEAEPEPEPEPEPEAEAEDGELDTPVQENSSSSSNAARTNEWNFTVYDFEGRGHISKQDVSTLMRNVFHVVKEQAKKPLISSCAVRLRLSINDANGHGQAQDQAPTAVGEQSRFELRSASACHLHQSRHRRLKQSRRSHPCDTDAFVKSSANHEPSDTVDFEDMAHAFDGLQIASASAAAAETHAERLASRSVAVDPRPPHSYTDSPNLGSRRRGKLRRYSYFWTHNWTPSADSHSLVRNGGPLGAGSAADDRKLPEQIESVSVVNADQSWPASPARDHAPGPSRGIMKRSITANFEPPRSVVRSCADSKVMCTCGKYSDDAEDPAADSRPIPLGMLHSSELNLVTRKPLDKEEKEDYISHWLSQAGGNQHLRPLPVPVPVPKAAKPEDRRQQVAPPVVICDAETSSAQDSCLRRRKAAHRARCTSQNRSVNCYHEHHHYHYVYAMQPVGMQPNATTDL